VDGAGEVSVDQSSYGEFDLVPMPGEGLVPEAGEEDGHRDDEGRDQVVVGHCGP